MNEENVKKDMKIPLSVMMDMARSEIGSHVINCMNTNNIPPFLMVYILKDITSDVMQAKEDQLSKEFIKINEEAIQEDQ
jgi:hypothetical protein